MKLSPMWQRATENMQSVIKGGMSERDQLECIQRTIYIAVGSDDRAEQKASAEHWCRILGQRHGSGWSGMLPDESEFYHEPLTFWHTIEGVSRRVTQDWFKKANLALECFRFNPSHVLELGSGFGQVGRLLLGLLPGMEYTVIDLPETLHFADIFLRLNFPEKRILKCAKLSDLAEPCDIRLVPAELSEEWANTKPGIDLFLNSSSLGEMDESVQTNYLRIVQDILKPKYTVLLNRLFNTYHPVIDRFREHECSWYFKLSSNWNIMQWELEPDFTRIPYSEMFHNREVFVSAVWSDTPMTAPDLCSLKLQYWFQKFSIKGEHRWCDQMGFDQSTIRALVESVRLTPRPDSVDMLVKYLWCVRKSRPFEEMPLLLQKYQELAGKPHPLETGHWQRIKQAVMGKAAAISQSLPTPIKKGLRQAYGG